jgi:hypothetical protein
VLFEKNWNVKRRAPLFRLHKLLGRWSPNSELSRDEKKSLDEYWDSEVEDTKKMFWSMEDDSNRKENNTKILSKSLIAIFVGYALVLLSSVFFLIIPSQFRKETLDECGLDPNRAENLIFLGFFTLKLQGEVC